MGKHDNTKFDRARDELMSHVVRCDVFEAAMDHRIEWLKETMDYMAERYPMLSDLQLTQLEMVGRQFIKPPIPHGRGHTASSRDDRIEELVEKEVEEEMPVSEVETPEELDEPQEIQASGEAAPPEDEAEEADLQMA